MNLQQRYAVIETAVNLWLLRLAELSEDEAVQTAFAWIQEETLEAAGVFSEILVVGGGKPGQAATAFNAFVKAMAGLAYLAPGGVSFGNLHFERATRKRATRT